MHKNVPIKFILNREEVTTELPPGTVLLDYLRQHRRLTGTKEGCRDGECGACLVLLGKLQKDQVHYQAVNSCLLPVGDIAGTHIVTIEGLTGEGLNPLQQAFVDESASQCGFCTPGFIVALSAFFLNSKDFTSPAAISAMDGNICRCTGYIPIKRAAEILTENLGDTIPPANSLERMHFLIEQSMLPSYFSDIPARLVELDKGISSGNSKITGRVIAGGTDLFVQEADELIAAGLTFVSRRKDLTRIWNTDGTVYLGAAVTVAGMHSEPILRQLFPELDIFMNLIASTPIRNRATIGGNIVNASPIGDLSIFFLALNASLALSTGQKRRILPLKDFFLDYKKLDLKENEFVEWLQFPMPGNNFLFNFEKVSKRAFLDIASVNSAMRLVLAGSTINEAGLSAGGVAPIPLVLNKTAAYLEGKKLYPETVKKAAKIAQSEISPISDVRGSAEYKKLLLRQLIFSHFVALFPDQFTPGVLL